MKVNFKGLKFKNWMYLMIFSVVILIVLWALQFLFLNTFYLTMKTNELIRIGEKIVSEYKESDFSDVISEYAYKNNLQITLLDESGEPVSNSNGSMQHDRFDFISRDFEKIQQAFADTDSDAVHFQTDEIKKGMDMSQIVYVAKVSGTEDAINYLCVSSPLTPIDSTVSVLQTQFFIITAIILILSLVVAQIISVKMSRPIIQLTKSAEKLAKGDMKVKFEGEGYTEISQLASTLNYATNELSKLDEYRKEFIANVSHDLKTPLTIIKMYGEMVQDVAGANPEKREAYSKKIVGEADWLSGMVNEILELSKLESGNAEITRTPVDLSRCVSDTLSSFQVLCDRDGYRFETDIDKNNIVQGSEQYLKRAVYNLISNAVNYTGEDKVVRISLKDMGGKIRFEVTDTGKGIPAEKLDSIWERYYKSQETHKRAVVGTGLGLSIVRHCLDLHGAAYGVDSKENRGSIFWFEIKK